MERIRERVDPDILIDFHLMVYQGKNPVLVKNGDEWGVVQDPSPLAQTPTLEQKAASVKYLTERGHGLPVQSTQVDIEIRARIDQLGSGISTNELMGIDPAALKLIQEAFNRARLPAPPPEDAIDAEFVELNANSPPLDVTSEPVTTNSGQ
jgi:hypothetical protein